MILVQATDNVRLVSIRARAYQWINRTGSIINPDRVRPLSTRLCYCLTRVRLTAQPIPSGFSIKSSYLSFINSTCSPLLTRDTRHRSISAYTLNPTTLPLHPIAGMYDYSFQGSSPCHQCRRDRICGHGRLEPFSTCFTFTVVPSSRDEGSSRNPI